MAEVVAVPEGNAMPEGAAVPEGVRVPEGVALPEGVLIPSNEVRKVFYSALLTPGLYLLTYSLDKYAVDHICISIMDGAGCG